MLHELQVHRQILFNLANHYLEPLQGNFQRLNYLASLRDPATGEYSHPRLVPVYGEAPVHEAIARSHQELFERLLELPLAQQELELRTCLDAWRGGREAALEYFEDTIQGWIPLEAPAYLRDLFCSNLNALRELLIARQDRARSST